MLKAMRSDTLQNQCYSINFAKCLPPFLSTVEDKMNLQAYQTRLSQRGFLRLTRMLTNALLGCSLLLFSACSGDNNTIVLYCAHDRQLAAPIIQLFEQRSGLRVKVVYDTEANKSVGLTNRILAEQQNPVADLFWNNEIGRTITLAQKGALARNPSGIDTAKNLPTSELESHWFTFAARARVIIANTDLVNKINPPSRVEDLADARWRGKAAFANPHFGTTGTHFAALYAQWGASRFRQWLQSVQENQIAMLPGNAQVKNAVAAGAYVWGLTDTDDYNEASLAGKPVKMIVPDQINTGSGVFIIPNTISLIEGAPHALLAKSFLQFILSAEVERKLAQGRGAQIPVRHSVSGPKLWPTANRVHTMQIAPTQIAASFQPMLKIFDSVWSSNTQ